MKMSKKEVMAILKILKGWKLKGKTISKTFKFKNFVESVQFVDKIVPVAEQMNHHPDIQIKYDLVSIALTTHDESGLTELDFGLAQKIECIKDPKNIFCMITDLYALSQAKKRLKKK